MVSIVHFQYKVKRQEQFANVSLIGSAKEASKFIGPVARYCTYAALIDRQGSRQFKNNSREHQNNHPSASYCEKWKPKGQWGAPAENHLELDTTTMIPCRYVS